MSFATRSHCMNMFLESKLLDKIISMSTSTHLSKLWRENVQPQDSFTPLLSTDYNYWHIQLLFIIYCFIPSSVTSDTASASSSRSPPDIIPSTVCNSLTHSQCLITGIPIAGLFSAHFIYIIYIIIFTHLILPVQLPRVHLNFLTLARCPRLWPFTTLCAVILWLCNYHAVENPNVTECQIPLQMDKISVYDASRNIGNTESSQFSKLSW